jgi:hypothetical protein
MTIVMCGCYGVGYMTTNVSGDIEKITERPCLNNEHCRRIDREMREKREKTRKAGQIQADQV